MTIFGFFKTETISNYPYFKKLFFYDLHLETTFDHSGIVFNLGAFSLQVNEGKSLKY